MLAPSQISVPWSTQPQEVVGIDWNNPLSQDLVRCMNFGVGVIDLVNANKNTTVIRTNSSLVNSPEGISLLGAGTLPQGVVLSNKGLNNTPFNGLIPDGTPFTIAIGVVPFSASTREAIFSDYVSGGSSSSINIEQTVTNTYRFSNGNSVTTGTTVPGKFTHLCFTRGSGLLNAYVDAVVGTSAASGSPTGGGSTVLGGPGDFTGGLNFKGRIPYFFLWNRVLSDSEIKSLSQNPWQLFEPQQVYVPRYPVTTAPRLRITEVPWSTQPQESVGIDWGNTLTQGLISVAVPNGTTIPANVVGPAWTAASGVSFGVGSAGRSVIATTTSQYWQTGLVDPIALSGFTALVFFRKTDSVNRASSLFGVTSGGILSNRLNAHVPWSDGLTYFDFGGASGNNRISVSGLDYSKPTVMVFAAGARGISITQDGVLKASNSVPISRTSAGVPFYYLKGDQPSGDLTETFLFCVWDRMLHNSEIAAVSANPWQLFKPEQVYVPQYASITYTGIPVLSALEFLSASATTARYRVQLTF